LICCCVVFVGGHSGADGRNCPLEQWLCLDEHPCLVGGTVKWAKVPEYAWWPALEFYQSGVEIVARRQLNAGTQEYDDEEERVNNDNVEGISSQQGPLLQGGVAQTDEVAGNASPLKATTVKQPNKARKMLFYFFSDDTYSLLNPREPRNVQPFFARSRDSRINFGKVHTSCFIHSFCHESFVQSITESQCCRLSHYFSF
jgi:hypothetical protein